MLLRMRLRHLGVIDDAEVELSDGLTVLTGETGAGKTMVVSGLGLLLGARADTGLVRAGSPQASVEGAVLVPPGHPALERACDAGAQVDEDGELVLVRTVSPAGRSRAHVGGRSAPVGVLAEVGEQLVAVHGQADQWRLRSPEQQRTLLDASAPATIRPARRGYEAAYRAHGETSAALAQARDLQRSRTGEADALRAGLAEIDRVDPRPGEDDELAAEAERLGHADDLRSAAGAAHAALVGDEATDPGAPAVVEALAAARAALSAVAAHDETAAGLADRVAELGYLATDLGADVASYLAGLEADPARLEAVQQRRAELTRLTRAYGGSVDEVLAWGRRGAARLAELDGAHDRVTALVEEEARARAELAAAAARLSRARVAAAADLGEAVTRELAQLAMGRAVVDVVVEQRPDPDGLVLPGAPDEDDEPGGATRAVRFGPTGVDDVEIRLAANPGAPPRGVGKAASGGELSRVMLALEVVIAGRDGSGEPDGGSGPRTGHGTEHSAGHGEPGGDVTTFVFDEVDAGIGGRAALAVGARLAALARHAQVVVVTHLAQVAAHADRHLVVSKASDGHVTSSGVREVTGEDRIAELARMMGGIDDVGAAREHARALLRQAGGERGAR